MLFLFAPLPWNADHTPPPTSQEKSGKGLMQPKAHPKATKRAATAQREAEDRAREKKAVTGGDDEAEKKRKKKQKSLGDF
jgi:hypothetical protein